MVSEVIWILFLLGLVFSTLICRIVLTSLEPLLVTKNPKRALRKGNKTFMYRWIRILVISNYFHISNCFLFSVSLNSSENVADPYLVDTEITVTGGVVGPTLARSVSNSPINITSILGRPQVRINYTYYLNFTNTFYDFNIRPMIYVFHHQLF